MKNQRVELQKGDVVRTRNVKCRFCKQAERFPQTDMFVENLNIEGKKNIYWHYDCYDKELERREKVSIELEKWDSLYDTVKEIHKIDIVPKDIIISLQDLRNGTLRFRANKKIRYKEGIEYNVIEKAYRMSIKKIEWVRRNKKFKTTKSEMVYCLMIVYDKLPEAKKELERMQSVDEMYVNPNHSYSDFIVEPITKKFPKS